MKPVGVTNNMDIDFDIEVTIEILNLKLLIM